MANFTLDTSGVVIGNLDQATVQIERRWTDLTPFAQGYVEALFADLRPAFYRIKVGVKPYGGKLLKTGYRAFDESGELREVTGWVHVSANKVATAQRLYRADELEPQPARFSDLAPETLARIMEDCAWFTDLGHWVVFNAEVGRDFWNDRQARQLTLAASKRLPPQTPYLGDDGRVYLKESDQ